MDLRKLRHRPESELARFKNGLNQIVRRLRYLGWVLWGISLLISFLLFFVFGLRLMPPKQKAPTKIYEVFHNSLNVAVTGPRATMKKRPPPRRARACPSPSLVHSNARGGQAPALR